MTERVLKNIMVGICVFLTVVIAAYVMYSYIYNPGKHGAAETAAESVPSVSAEYDSNSAADPYDSADFGGYIARIKDDTLAIYAVNDGREEFLYNLNVRIEDISDAEKKNLTEGIRLSDKKALASFEEDFTG